MTPLRCTRILFAATLLISAAGPARAQMIDDSRLTVEPVVGGLSLPTAMEFIAPDDFLVGEKNSGRVKRVVNGVVTGVVLDLPVASEATRGLLGMALHPDFAANGYVYVFYSRAESDGGTWLENRVSRFTWDGAALEASSELVLARFVSDAAQNTAPACEGGALRFGPDGKLYGCIGDLGRGGFENPRIEQNSDWEVSANSGGIFRLNDDGGVPADNPFAPNADTALRRFFSYGVRNTYGLDFDPHTGALWATENGPDVFDEINRVLSGMNSGWLKIMGPDERDALFEKNEYTAYDADDLVQLPGSHYADPKLSFFQPVGLTSLVFIDSPRFPCDLQGQMLIGDANTGQLYLLALNAERDGFALPPGLDDLVADSPEERQSLVFGSGWGVTTDLQLGPDGNLYQVSLSRGGVYRIRPSGPFADLTGDGVVGLADLQRLLAAFHYSAAGDLDCDGDTDLADLSALLSEFE